MSAWAPKEQRVPRVRVKTNYSRIVDWRNNNVMARRIAGHVCIDPLRNTAAAGHRVVFDIAIGRIRPTLFPGLGIDSNNPVEGRADNQVIAYEYRGSPAMRIAEAPRRLCPL